MKIHNRVFGLGLIGVACCVFGPACTSTSSTSAPDDSSGAVEARTSDLELRDTMRRLWQDHAIWTRVYLIGAIGGFPDAPPTMARLLQNQIDIGDALEPFYGEAVGHQLSWLLHDHVVLLGEVVAAAKTGSARKLAIAKNAWYTTADRIAALLSEANPSWPAADLGEMMRVHLDRTFAEVTARLAGDWASDVVAFDAVVEHVTAIADALTAGIARQFPDEVSESARTASDQELHRAMRRLWEEHVAWTRVFLIAAVGDRPEGPVASARLLESPIDIGAALAPYLGSAAADRLAGLLRDHVIDTAAVVRAAKTGNARLLALAKRDWYANADDVATFLSSVNPSWSTGELGLHMRAHLDQTLAEISARLAGDWSTDVASYDRVVEHVLVLADVLSEGTVKLLRARAP